MLKMAVVHRAIAAYVYVVMPVGLGGLSSTSFAHLQCVISNSLLQNHSCTHVKRCMTIHFTTLQEF
jgi:uncharacterized membrane protein